MRRTLPLLFLCLLGGLALSCSSTPKEPKGKWVDEQLHAPSDRVLWQVALLAVQKMRFPLAAGLDPSEGVIHTGWKTTLQPFQGEGFRERAEIEVSPVEPGLWQVRARVKRQTNESLVAPLDPTRAEWEWAPDNPNSALILVQHMRALLPDELSFEREKADGEALDAYLREVERR